MILSFHFIVIQPEDVKFIMIDPKVVELSVYNDILHLLDASCNGYGKAANALRWCVDMKWNVVISCFSLSLSSALRVRNIEGFNEKIDEYEAMQEDACAKSNLATERYDGCNATSVEKIELYCGYCR